MKLAIRIPADMGVEGVRALKGAVDLVGGSRFWRVCLIGRAMVVKPSPLASCMRRRLKASVMEDSDTS